MVAVPSVGCKMLLNRPDSRGCADEAPGMFGIASLTLRLTTSRSGRNAYQAAKSATAATGIAIFIHLFISVSPRVQVTGARRSPDEQRQTLLFFSTFSDRWL